MKKIIFIGKIFGVIDHIVNRIISLKAGDHPVIGKKFPKKIISQNNLNMGSVTCKIWALQGNIGPLGGQVEIGAPGNPTNFPLWDGRLIGSQCNGKLNTTDAHFGVGISFHRISTSTFFDCRRDCEFESGQEVKLVIFTILFVTITEITMSFCETKSKWLVNLGLGVGWNLATWRVA